MRRSRFLSFFLSFFKGSLLVVGTLAVCIALLEGAVRLFLPVRNVGPSFTMYDPVYGKRLKPNFEADRFTPEFEMHLATNSLGFRGGEPIGRIDHPILFFGDSFTMGYGVTDGDEFPAIVGEHLLNSEIEEPVQVVNVGMGDNGNGRPLKFLRDEAVDLKPRLIVLQLAENDFYDNIKERLFKLNDAGDGLVELDVGLPGKAQRAQAWIEAIPGAQYSYLVGFAREAVSAVMALGAPKRTGSTSKEAEERDRLTYRLVQELLSSAEEMSWPSVVLTVGLSDHRLRALRDLSDRYDVDLINVPSKQQRSDLYYAVDGHWNAAGHAFVADLILSWLEDNSDVWFD